MMYMLFASPFVMSLILTLCALRNSGLISQEEGHCQ